MSRTLRVVKLRELGYLFGFKPAPRTYGYQLKRFTLAEGDVDYAQWMHPGETPKHVCQDEVDQLRAFLQEGDVAIDIGAHTGDSTMPMALAVGATGMVLALEPNPYVFRILERNATLNPSKTRIVPLNFAATAKEGEYEFEYSDAGFCNGGLHQGVSKWRHAHAFKLRVRGEHLPTYLEQHFPESIPRLRYVKVDAEGYDLDVLSSLHSLLVSRRPVVRAEVYKFSPRATRERLHALLTGLNYDVRRWVSEREYRGELLGREDMMNWPHFDIFCMPR
ncbi:MAG: FkbM family methyltransferase [Vicinamibacterales bacterium]